MFVALFLITFVHIGTASAEPTFIDLTHEIPTFAPMKDDPLKPDLANPIGHSTPIAWFYHQAILYPADKWATSDGHFNSAAFLIQELNGTSFNSPNYYINNEKSLEPSRIPANRRKSAEALTMEQLTGKIVLIDVSDRVSIELARNDGMHSPDVSITDFSDSSQATIRAEDIAADGLSTDSGEGAKGTDDRWSNAWPAHVRLYQRDILLVENLANLSALVDAARQSSACYLVVGATKHVGGTGGPARVVAVCENEQS